MVTAMINGWERTLQQILLERGEWHMCCGCILLNMTRREQAEPVWPQLFERYPDAEAACRRMEPERDDALRLLRSMGMASVRFNRLLGFSRDWVEMGRPESAGDLERRYHGMGRYAGDSWRIFVEGRTDVEPNDGVLAEYLNAL